MFKNFSIEKIIIFLFTVIMAFAVYRILTADIKITLIPHITAVNFLYQMRFEFIPGIGYREAGSLFIKDKVICNISFRFIRNSR